MNALSGTTTGAFDELLVRNPSFTGEYENVLSLISGELFDDTALRTSIDANSSSISFLASTTADSMATKRSTVDIYDVGQIDVFLDAKASVPQLDAALTTLSDSVTSRLTGKLDKAAAYTSTEVDQLFVVAADASSAALSTKRDEAQSYTITQVDALVAGVRPISGVEGLQDSLNAKADQSATVAALSLKQDQADSYTSSEVDSLLSDKQATITNNGNIDILAIGGLYAALQSFQADIGSGDLSISMTNGLQMALYVLAIRAEGYS
jgi:hypothetical protein